MQDHCSPTFDKMYVFVITAHTLFLLSRLQFSICFLVSRTMKSFRCYQVLGVFGICTSHLPGRAAGCLFTGTQQTQCCERSYRTALFALFTSKIWGPEAGVLSPEAGQQWLGIAPAMLPQIHPQECKYLCI